MLGSNAGRTAIVTGAAQGIGRAIAQHFAALRGEDERGDIKIKGTPSPKIVATRNLEFSLEHVFDQFQPQDEVFRIAAQGHITSVLEGFNACLIAYGQTGAGKTFTMTGGTEGYAARAHRRSHMRCLATDTTMWLSSWVVTCAYRPFVIPAISSVTLATTC